MSPEFEDQSGRTVRLNEPPRRIVSLVPSQTEFLYDLGLGENLVGITKFCVHPEHLRREKTLIGGTKNIRIETVLGLEPDLVIANKEENPKRAIQALSEKVPVWVTDVSTIEESYAMMADLGKITGKASEADEWIGKTRDTLASIRKELSGSESPSALYLIWKDPYMAAGTDTFISDVLRILGIRNVLATRGDQGLRYPALSVEDMRELKPDFVLLSSEPYPFQESHASELRAEINGPKFVCVDGESFSWYGSRLYKSAAAFRDLSRHLSKNE